MRIGAIDLGDELIRRYESLGYWVDSTTNSSIEINASRFADVEALRDERTTLTHAQLFEQARRLARYWQNLGFGENDVIAIQLPNQVEFAVVVHSAMLAGVRFCTFHHGFRKKEVDFILSYVGASAVVVPRSYKGFDYPAMIAALRPGLPKLQHVFAVGSLESAPSYDSIDAILRAAPVSPIARERLPHGNDVARIAFTSGTTGDPKAVLHTHNTTNCSGRALNREHLIDQGSTLLLFLPVGLNWGFFNTIQAAIAGCRLIYHDKFDAARVLGAIEREGVTHFGTAPASLIDLLDEVEAGHYDLGSLKAVIVGGATVSAEVVRRAQRLLPCPLLDLYGMLESGFIAGTSVSDDLQSTVGFVGRPIKEMEVKVVDDKLQERPIEEIGEIVVRGPSVAVGYLRNQEANRERYADGNWFHTGDLGAFDRRGYLRIAGRSKDMIIRGGANIYPREIEEILYAHPLIHDCAVVGLPHERLGEIVCVCVVPKPGQNLTLDDLIGFLKDKIAKYKLPEKLLVVPELPRTPTGKVQKHVLSELVRAKT